MHRSGTSSVAGVLARLGAHPPATLLPASADNPRGFWESRRVMDLNERILRAGASYWRDWRPFRPGFSKAEAAALHDEIAAVVRAEFGDAGTIVVKDPRMCRMMALWTPGLARAGYEPRFVLPIRSPLEVAASLRRRNGVSEPDGQLLWLRHVLDAEFSTRGRPRAFVLWSRFISDWRSEVARIEAAADWRFPARAGARAQDIDAFLSPELRTETAPDEALDGASGSHEWIATAYGALKTLAVEGETPAVLARLDRIRRALDVSGHIYGPAHGEALAAVGRAQSEKDTALGLLIESEQVVDHMRGNLFRANDLYVEAEGRARSAADSLAVSEARLQAEAGRAARLEDECARAAALLAHERGRAEALQADLARATGALAAERERSGGLAGDLAATTAALAAERERSSDLEAQLESRVRKLADLRRRLETRPLVTGLTMARRRLMGQFASPADGEGGGD